MAYSITSGWPTTDSELLHKLRKFYKQPNAVKISEKLKNEKMLHEIEFYRDQWLDDIHDEEWDRRFTKNIDINKPCRNPPFFENLIWSLIKFWNCIWTVLVDEIYALISWLTLRKLKSRKNIIEYSKNNSKKVVSKSCLQKLSPKVVSISCLQKLSP